jgi:hypothetical protein
MNLRDLLPKFLTDNGKKSNNSSEGSIININQEWTQKTGIYLR